MGFCRQEYWSGFPYYCYRKQWNTSRSASLKDHQITVHQNLWVHAKTLLCFRNTDTEVTFVQKLCMSKCQDTTALEWIWPRLQYMAFNCQTQNLLNISFSWYSEICSFYIHQTSYKLGFEGLEHLMQRLLSETMSLSVALISSSSSPLPTSGTPHLFFHPLWKTDLGFGAGGWIFQTHLAFRSNCDLLETEMHLPELVFGLEL